LVTPEEYAKADDECTMHYSQLAQPITEFQPNSNFFAVDGVVKPGFVGKVKNRGDFGDLQ
jgi:hypothetical protein